MQQGSHTGGNFLTGHQVLLLEESRKGETLSSHFLILGRTALTNPFLCILWTSTERGQPLAKTRGHPQRDFEEPLKGNNGD